MTKEEQSNQRKPKLAKEDQQRSKRTKHNQECQKIRMSKQVNNKKPNMSNADQS